MNKIILLIILTFFTLKTSGQIGLINDADGYTNVRKEPSIKSEILYKVKENEVFFIDVEYLNLESDWILIHIPKSKFSKYDSDWKPYDLNGFIHKSRIRDIDSLPTVTGNNIKLIFKIVKADPNKDLDQGTFGLDIPLSISYEVKDLTLEWNGERFPQLKELYNDLYNVSFNEGIYDSTEERFKIYFFIDTYFIRQKCADGGGYYEIVWVIRDGEIIQRLAGWII